MRPEEFLKIIKEQGLEIGDIVEVKLDHVRTEILKICGGDMFQGKESEWIGFAKVDEECSDKNKDGWHIGHIEPQGIRLIKKGK